MLAVNRVRLRLSIENFFFIVCQNRHHISQLPFTTERKPSKSADYPGLQQFAINVCL